MTLPPHWSSSDTDNPPGTPPPHSPVGATRHSPREELVAEAKASGDLLKERNYTNFDAAFTSTLERAIATCDLALKHAGSVDTPVRKAWQLNERHYGALQGRRKDDPRIEEAYLWQGAANVLEARLSRDSPGDGRCAPPLSTSSGAADGIARRLSTSRRRVLEGIDIAGANAEQYGFTSSSLQHAPGTCGISRSSSNREDTAHSYSEFSAVRLPH